MEGKAMIVCMSRRICVGVYKQVVKRHPEWHSHVYKQVVKRHPEWHSQDDEQGTVKVVMSGSASDPVDWQPHIRNKQRRDRLAQRFKDPNDPLKVAIGRGTR
jgi:type I restriction enzyme R subunit